MKYSEQILGLFSETTIDNYDWHKDVIINKSKFLEKIDAATKEENLLKLRERVSLVKSVICHPAVDKEGLLNIDRNGDTMVLNKKTLLDEISQLEDAQTLDRAKYYLERLKKGISEIKTSKINDINLNRWKEYSEIITDSLWILGRRDNSGVHTAWYWGNFVPQIPHQLMLRYTKKNDWVLDPFVGSGTTLIECQRLGRNGIGVELNPEIAERATELIRQENNSFGVRTEVITADSRTVNLREMLNKHNIKNVQLVIMHPPYHDIIKFGKNDRDLSNAPTTESFVQMFGEVVDNTMTYLEKGRYLAVVIGDKYCHGQWIPIGFYLMNEMLKRDFTLKGIIVKNFEETRGKRNQKELWRFRALAGGFYVFKHEYILLFKKGRAKNAIT